MTTSTKSRAKANVTQREIANHCNVSTSTVSGALNDKQTVRISVKRQIVGTAIELGYMPRPSFYFACLQKKSKISAACNVEHSVIGDESLATAIFKKVRTNQNHIDYAKFAKILCSRYGLSLEAAKELIEIILDIRSISFIMSTLPRTGRSKT